MLRTRRRIQRWAAIGLALLASVGLVSGVCLANPYESHYAIGGGAWQSNCTWWAWQRWQDVNGEALPRWGNAGEWVGNAQASGYRVDAVPEVGSIVATWESPLGHVAFVEAIDPDNPNAFLISEYGFAPGVDRNDRWLTTDGSLLFIHPHPVQEDEPVVEETVERELKPDPEEMAVRRDARLDWANDAIMDDRPARRARVESPWNAGATPV